MPQAFVTVLSKSQNNVICYNHNTFSVIKGELCEVCGGPVETGRSYVCSLSASCNGASFSSLSPAGTIGTVGTVGNMINIIEAYSSLMSCGPLVSVDEMDAPLSHPSPTSTLKRRRLTFVCAIVLRLSERTSRRDVRYVQVTVASTKKTLVLNAYSQASSLDIWPPPGEMVAFLAKPSYYDEKLSYAIFDPPCFIPRIVSEAPAQHPQCPQCLLEMMKFTEEGKRLAKVYNAKYGVDEVMEMSLRAETETLEVDLRPLMVCSVGDSRVATTNGKWKKSITLTEGNREGKQRNITLTLMGRASLFSPSLHSTVEARSVKIFPASGQFSDPLFLCYEIPTLIAQGAVEKKRVTLQSVKSAYRLASNFVFDIHDCTYTQKDGLHYIDGVSWVPDSPTSSTEQKEIQQLRVSVTGCHLTEDNTLTGGSLTCME